MTSRRMSVNAAGNDASAYELIPELGDSVTFLSDVYGRTYGRIIYRDGSLIRIRPYTSSTTGVEFPLDTATGLFLDRLGVSEVIIHEKRTDPHFVTQMAFVPGERLEMFGADGTMLSEPAPIYEVIATHEYDAVKLESGEVIDFGFLGPPDPIVVVRAVAAPEEVAPPENEGSGVVNVEPEQEEVFPELDYDLLPAALVEEIATEERTYSDSIQREDMFLGLLTDYPVKRQKDPKIMAQLYRTTDLLLALKNSVIKRDESGAPLTTEPPRSYMALTIQDAIEKQSTGMPLSAVIPVIRNKKVLYVDDNNEGEHIHTEIRSDPGSLVDLSNAGMKFADYISETAANPYILYLNDILRLSDAYVGDGQGFTRIQVDQDVLRSAVPPTPVEGFPSVPPAVKKGRSEEEAKPLTLDYLATIDDRHIRLIGPTRVYDPRTGTLFTVAAGDAGSPAAHILLSKSVAAHRAPIRSSVLLWDIQASEASRTKRTGTFYKSMMDSWADQVVLHEPLDLMSVLEDRLIPSLSYITKENVTVMDSLGLRFLELTEDSVAPFRAAIMAGTSAWDRAYGKLRARAIQSLEGGSRPAIPSVAADDSALVSGPTFDNTVLAAAVEPLKEKETSLRNYDLALANNVLKETNSTLGPLWYAAANSGAAPELVMEAEIAFKAESGRIQRSTQVVRDLRKEFTAAPSVNPCVHVAELEKVRGIRNDQERMLVFQKFLKTYQGAQQGNYVLCSSCGKDLVCRHELLLLNEFMNPGRGVALHKSLLLEYAGPVFEGAYICKSCGQKIADLEYDTHLEFDDEGRPLVGRTAVDPKTQEEDEEEADELKLATLAEAEQAIPYSGADRAIYFNLRTLFERCGMAMDTNVYERTVKAAKSYLEKNLKDEASYNKLRENAAKLKKVMPVYETYYAETQIKIVGALVVLELQTSDIHIPIPAGGCKLSRDGFPRDGGDPATAGNGALAYVACALAGIMNLNPPWSKTSWSPETRMEVRRRTVENTLLGTLYSMLSLPIPKTTVIPPPIDNITDVYKERLAAAREKKVALTLETSTDALPSYADTLPPSYRPLPRMVAPSALDETPIGNVAQFKRNIEEGDIEEVGQLVKSRQRQLVQSLMADFHKEGEKDGIVLAGSGRSDSVCCFKRLGAVGVRGLGVRALGIGEAKLEEARLIDDVSRSFSRRDPALSCNGTHIMVPWSAPISTSVLPEADPSVYYKLFLKNCYKGRNYGLVHEFGPNNVCRHCDFHIPEELLYAPAADISENDSKRREAELNKILKRREEAALLAFNTQGVDISTESFRNLEEQIRRKRAVVVPEPPADMSFLQRIQTMTGMLGGLVPSAAQDWETLVVAMTEIQTKGLRDMQRLRALADFSSRYDQRVRGTQTAITRGITQAREVAAAMEKLAYVDGITDEPVGNTSVRNVIDMFVVRSEQVARGFKNLKPNILKWFNSVSRSHRDLIDKIWEKEAEVTVRALEAIGEFGEGDEAVISTIRLALERFTAWLGPWMNIWLNEFRAGGVMTEEEYILLLRWTVHTGILSLLTPSCALYAGAPSLEVQMSAVGFMRVWILDNLKTHHETVQKYQLSPEQIRDALNARAELEKAMFIGDFDKQDREGRKIELMKKKLKIGKWDASNLFTINAVGFEFEREQRARMGLLDFDPGVTGGAGGAAAENPYGFMDFGAQSVGMDDISNHRAAQDEDA